MTVGSQIQQLSDMPKKQPSPSATWKSTLVWLPLWVILLPLWLLILPIVGYELVCAYFRTRRFLADHDGELFVVASSHHGWRDFLVNNVLPVLSSENHLVCRIHRKSGIHKNAIILEILRGRQIVPLKPFAVRVNAQKLDVYPLRDLLLPMKQSSCAKSEIIRHHVREHLNALKQ